MKGQRLSRTRRRRVAFAIATVILVVIVGTIGFHEIEGMGFVDALYFETMLATGQGPPLPLTTDAGKIFASIMAFVSVGSVLTTLVFTLGPILTQIWREGLERAEAEARTIESEIKGKTQESKDK